MLTGRIKSSDVWGLSVGGFTAAVQTILLREALSVAGGNEVAAALSFTGWFLGTASGAWLSARLGARRSRSVPLSLFSISAASAGLLLLRLHRLLMQIPIGEDPSLMGTAAVVSAALWLGGLTSGLLFTLSALGLNDAKGAPVSRFYAAESIGAVLGAGLFFALLAPRAAHLTGVAASAALLLVGAGIASCGASRPIAFGLGFVIAVTAALGGTARLDFQLEQAVYHTLRDAPLVAYSESAYGRVALTFEADQYELWIDGRFERVFPEPYDRPVPVHLALTLHPHPDTVLLIGGGPSDRLSAALAHHGRRVVLTFLNDSAEAICRPFFSPDTLHALRDPRASTLHGDGRRYVAETSERFDAVVVFSRPPQTAGENRYYTRAFYKDVFRILNPGGLAAFIAPGGAGALSEEAALADAAIYDNLQSVFPKVGIVAGLETIFIAARDSGTAHLDPVAAAERYRRRDVEARSFSAARFEELLNSERRERRLRELEAVLHRTSSGSLPAIYAANLRLWERTSGGFGDLSDSSSLLEALSNLSLCFFVLPALLIAVFRFRKGKGATSFSERAAISTAVTGASGIAAQLAVMIAFQSTFGTLYLTAALLSGTFMSGLACGAVLGRRFPAAGVLRQIATADVALILFLAASASVLGAGTHSAFLFYVWSLVAGAITGAAFPAFLGFAARDRGEDERLVAARIEGADHLGAAFGAFVLGIVWMPAYGIAVSCLLLALLKLEALLFCFGNSNT